METFWAFVIAGAVTLFFVRRYLKELTSSQQKTVPASWASNELQPCPRCAQPISRAASFCSHCGAAMAMWKVHKAEQTNPATATASGKPQPLINASLCIGCGSCIEACPESGTLELLNHKAILAHPERCTGHAKCTDVCPTQAISLSMGGVLQTVKVPLIRENFETNVSDVFIVGELSGFGLIKTAINEGKLVVDHIQQRVEHSPKPVPDDMYDLAIVGAGPAGLSASLTAMQYGLKYITLEQGEIASTIRNYPRQKFLMAEPLEIPLYGSLYVGDGTKEALLSVWESIIVNTGVRVNTNERVECIQRNSAGFHVRTACNDYHARHVVLALGRRGTPRKLGVPGEELSKVSYRLIEASEYTNKKILVVGGGDSAIEAALALSNSGTNHVTLSYRGGEFMRARSRNREAIETAARNGQVDLLLHSNVVEIRPTEVLLLCGDGDRTLGNDYVFVMVGGESPDEFLSKAGVEIVEKRLSAGGE